MKKLKVLDLFSGIGGFSLGLERTGGFETVAFCEIDVWCQKILAKNFPNIPIYNDVRKLDYGGPVDVITGGYPCQPFSVAGKRKGTEDDRHLWPAMFNLIQKYRPTWVIGENVAGHINMGLDRVLADLESESYATRAFVIPACAVDAKHRRDRLWIVGHAEHNGSPSPKIERGFTKASEHHQKREDETKQFKGTGGHRNDETLADTNSVRMEGSRAQQQTTGIGGEGETLANSKSGKGDGNEHDYGNGGSAIQGISRKYRGSSTLSSRGEYCRWFPEPDVGRVAPRLSDRVDRLKGLGNAVVPQIPEIIGNAILQANLIG